MAQQQAQTALLEADAARQREHAQQQLVAQLQQRASQAAQAAAKAAKMKGGAEMAALQQAQAHAESVAGELNMTRGALEQERSQGREAAQAHAAALAEAHAEAQRERAKAGESVAAAQRELAVRDQAMQESRLQASLFKQRVQAKMQEERQRAEGREAALMRQKEDVLALLAQERRALASAKREAGAAQAQAQEQTALVKREASYREAEAAASRAARREAEAALLREQAMAEEVQRLKAKADQAALAAVRRMPISSQPQPRPPPRPAQPHELLIDLGDANPSVNPSPRDGGGLGAASYGAPAPPPNLAFRTRGQASTSAAASNPGGRRVVVAGGGMANAGGSMGGRPDQMMPKGGPVDRGAMNRALSGVRPTGLLGNLAKMAGRLELNAEKKRHMKALEKMRKAEMASDAAYDREELEREDDEVHVRRQSQGGGNLLQQLGRLFGQGGEGAKKTPIKRSASMPGTPGGSRGVMAF